MNKEINKQLQGDFTVLIRGFSNSLVKIDFNEFANDWDLHNLYGDCVCFFNDEVVDNPSATNSLIGKAIGDYLSSAKLTKTTNKAFLRLEKDLNLFLNKYPKELT